MRDQAGSGAGSRAFPPSVFKPTSLRAGAGDPPPSAAAGSAATASRKPGGLASPDRRPLAATPRPPPCSFIHKLARELARRKVQRRARTGERGGLGRGNGRVLLRRHALHSRRGSRPQIRPCAAPERRCPGHDAAHGGARLRRCGEGQR